VAQVLEPDRPNDRLDPELPAVVRATPLVLVGRALDVAAALPPADVPVALDHAGAAERAAERVLEVNVPPHHRAVLAREDELRRRNVDRET
jgi:hypothetical protein